MAKMSFFYWTNAIFDHFLPFLTNIRYGMVWYGMVWYTMVYYGMVWYGFGHFFKPFLGHFQPFWVILGHFGQFLTNIRYGMVWYSMVWYGMV